MVEDIINSFYKWKFIAVQGAYRHIGIGNLLLELYLYRSNYAAEHILQESTC